RIMDDDVKAAVGAAGRPGAAAGADGLAPERPAVARPLAAVGVEPPALPRFEQWGPVERQPLSHLRRTIAERMTLSATLIPHVTHFDRADITELDAIIRRNVEPARERSLTLTLTSFLLKAAALALQEHPQFNASLDPAAGELIVKRYHHLGVAVATERGLIVPVIRDVDHKPLVEVQRELAALAQRVREGKATLEDLRGGTFTITNIGALGGTGAIPIINYPEVAILGVARGREEPGALGRSLAAGVPPLARPAREPPRVRRRLRHRRPERGHRRALLARRRRRRRPVRRVPRVRARGRDRSARQLPAGRRAGAARQGRRARRRRLRAHAQFRAGPGAHPGGDEAGAVPRRHRRGVRLGLRRRDAADAPLLGRGRRARPASARAR